LIARSGYEDGYLDNFRISWDEAQDIGRGPTGTAIRTGKPHINQDSLANINLSPWRDAIIKSGYKASIALPLIIQRQTIGALTVYSAETDPFSSQEVVLMEELARNIAFGAEALRTRRQKEESETELAEAQRIAHIGNWTLDLVTGKLRWSREIFRLFEIEPDQFEATYEAFINVVHPDDRELVGQAMAESRGQRTSYEIDHRLLMRDGRIKWVQERCITEFDAAGTPLRLHGTTQDISERKQAEAMLLQSQKMEAIGTLAGGIAHDFNNILTGILGFNNLILGDIGNPEAVASHVHQIHTAGFRAKDLVRQILTFSRQMPSNKGPIDLCQVVNEVYQLVRTAAPANVKITLELPPGRAMILGSSVELHQVLMNLCLNSIDAIGGRNGSISIVLSYWDGTFYLSVTDSGCGISEEIRLKLFDPFFTTKSATGGTGLGLSVVLGIVEDLGGHISVETPLEGGARFIVRLPELESVVEEKSPVESLALHRSTIERRHILVVDDDPMVANLLQHFFERKGHRVSCCVVSADALEWIKRGDRFDIVITDQMMPDVSGIELARSIAQCSSGTKVLLCTGRDDLIDYDEIAEAQIDGFFLKPFDLEDLSDMVESLFEKAPSTVG
jgi:PAS domain S-box-containing protein